MLIKLPKPITCTLLTIEIYYGSSDNLLTTYTVTASSPVTPASHVDYNPALMSID